MNLIYNLMGGKNTALIEQLTSAGLDIEQAQDFLPEALQSVMGGPYTLEFWLFFVCIGLLIPLVIETLEISGVSKSLAMLAPVLVIIGGYALRQVVLDAGQESTWTHYETQYSSELLERLHEENP